MDSSVLSKTTPADSTFPSKSSLHDSALGYVVAVSPGGLLVWTKMDGGALAFAPMELLHDATPPPLQSELELYPVAVTMEKVEVDLSNGARFNVPAYRCISLHYVTEEVAKTYFPSFLIDGSMTFLLDNDGAVLRMPADYAGTYTMGDLNVNRATPKPKTDVFCPPWSFVDSKISGLRWLSHCRVDGHYKCRIVFVRDQELAFGCQWISLASKFVPTTINPCFEINWTKVAETKQRCVADYKMREKQDAKFEDWNADDCRDRIEIIWGAQATGYVGKLSVGTPRFQENCSSLLQFLQDNSEEEGAGTAISTRMPGPKLRNKQISNGTQTNLDLQFFEEIEEWLKRVGVCMESRDYEEFWYRFKSLKIFFDKM